mmetsp:Transcript_67536/g.187255  ORF Transcript_67536/g.187255 Transcript_67536/m.187255 type:complete len:198 (-) Transcript_67536:173-766(-)|eukprot:CAMPEP_0179102528 /NCGR_PEP_ID=MMETSP0796-20121207/47459_1 /TAXON_ID=73915 /ORGANISM="Pyrodinium bahamense, Strain pbaha01" /LENGTH=197 /DNA_ID=CAMNT_0020800407 /DNA_START=42 /DNA_END=635 /DNA_ORIENTATION=-
MPVERCPPRNGFQPVLNDGEEIRHSEASTKLYAGQNLEGEGILHLTNQRLVWLGTATPGVGYAIDYPFITLHAVSRDKGAWPEPCLYCQLRTEETADDDGEDEEPDIPELRFVPADVSHLQSLFIVFSEMSALNPDPHDPQAEDDSEEEEDDESVVDQPGQIGVMWNAEDNDAAMEDAEDEEDEEGEHDVAMGVEVK